MYDWHIRYGSWWMVQWSFAGWLSFGVHIDFRRRVNSTLNVSYGPYIDMHLGMVILSIGHNPAYSGEIHRLVNIARGGVFF